MNPARFGVTKPVPVNLLMFALLFGGLVAGLSLRREFFPETEPDQALITLPYPGASPEEVEESLAIKVEDKLADLDEVDELRTNVSEGGGGITVEFREGIDPDKALDEVQRAVDALLDLPEEAETIQVRLFEPRLPVIRVAVHGDLDEGVMKRAIRAVRDDLQSLPRMGEVLIDGVRDYEVRVDVRQEALLKYGVSLPEVSARVGDWLTDIPGGTVRSRGGNIKVRTLGVPERAEAIREIVVRADPSGQAVRVGDIAEVSETFVDEQIVNRFNGEPAAMLTVFKVGDQDIVNMAEMVRAYVKGRRGEPFGDGWGDRVLVNLAAAQRAGDPPGTPLGASWLDVVFGTDRLRAYEMGVRGARPLPPGATIATTSDLARFVEGRLDLLLRNALMGAGLVFLTLFVFLNVRVALWVGAGLTTALGGTLVLMAATGVTLNLLTMFGLIVVLGLLVDDAIVVSENIQARHDRGEPALSAAISGTNQVAWPVVATVLTTVVAFLPLSFIRGRIGDLLGALPAVVACALLMSLVESILILPSHMGHSLAKRDRAKHAGLLEPVRAALRRFEAARDHVLLDRVVPAYGRVLELVLHYRYVSMAIAVATLLVSVGMFAGGRVAFNFLPSSDAETVVVDLRLPIGAPLAATQRVVEAIEDAASALPETQSVAAVVGQRSDIETGSADASSPHIAQLFIELWPVEQRDRESSRVIDDVRRRIAPVLDEVERISFTEITGGPAGEDITLRISGRDSERVAQVVGQVKRELASFEGVFDIADDNDLGQLELRIRLLPGAAALGLSTQEVARQVRGLLFGLDAHVFAAQQEDIDVRVRIDEATRRSLFAVQNVWLVTPDGRGVPLTEVAEVTESPTYANIKRVDRRRTTTVTASTADGLSPEAIVGGLEPVVARLRAQYPTMSIEFAGRQEQQADAFESLPYGFLAASVMIYVILAWLFSSYLQPVVVMLAIPFAIIGVVWGHLLLGYDMTFLSLIGFVALAGIVVNDSLILMEFYNHERDRGVAVRPALVAAGRARLRAILMTTITTVLGLTPLILERSFQAKFLIPMAISIAAGLISATVLILLVLPGLILILEDLKSAAYFCWTGRPRPEAGSRIVTLPPDTGEGDPVPRLLPD